MSKKLVLEEVAVDGTEFTGIVWGDQLPKELQELFSIPNDQVIRLVGDFSITYFGQDYIDCQFYDAVAYLGEKETKVDLLSYVDTDSLKDVVLAKYESYPGDVDYEEGMEDA